MMMERSILYMKKIAHPKYYVNNNVVASVTTVIGNNLGWNKAVLLGWSRKMAMQGTDPNAIKNNAAKIGTLTHKMVENYIQGKETNIFLYSDAEVATAKVGFKAYLEWEEEYNPEYLMTEARLVSNEYLYGGTIDTVVNIHGKIGLLDLKTSNNI